MEDIFQKMHHHREYGCAKNKEYLREQTERILLRKLLHKAKEIVQQGKGNKYRKEKERKCK